MPGGDGGERGDGTQAAEEEEHPTHDDDDYKRATICISSQVGCAVNCQFCLTAKLGIRRNLTPGEIAGQVAAVLNRQNVEVGRDRINLVFMGMGEPFLNYAGFMAAVGLLTAAMRIPESRMTVSTSGILPGILDFAKETVRPKLAVSLNASNDIVRESIMPITRKWNIAALLDAIAKVPLRPRERVTFEYVMLGGINDQTEHASELIALLKNMQAKINLIVWNSGPNMPFHEPTPRDVAAFQKRLRDAGIPAFIRRPRGRDIYAACGQLKRTLEQPAPLVAIAPAATLPG
jgi:23S rRNA (adenine2503-C2)-methyltransferase